MELLGRGRPWKLDDVMPSAGDKWEHFDKRKMEMATGRRELIGAGD